MSELYRPLGLQEALGDIGLTSRELTSWMELATARGATPRSGPLAHDLLVSTPNTPDRIGLNVFGHGSDVAIRELVFEQAPMSSKFLRSLGTSAVWNAGRYHDRSGQRLKLYLTGDLSVASSLWPPGLPPCRPMALGVDLEKAGPARHRVYVNREDPGSAALEEGWTFPSPLPWPCQAPWVSHHLVTAGVRTGKRTRNWIFRIDAPISALRDSLSTEHQESLDLATSVPLGPGLEWGPVALEADAYEDGPGSVDWLLTIRRSA